METALNDAEHEQKGDLDAKKLARLATAREWLGLPDEAFPELPPRDGIEYGPDTPSEGRRSAPSSFADPAATFGSTTHVGSQGRPQHA